MKRKIIAAILLGCTLSIVGCGERQQELNKDATNEAQAYEEESEEIVEIEETEETEVEIVETAPVIEEAEEADTESTFVVEPLPSTINLDNLEDCTLAVEVSTNSIQTNDNGENLLKVKVFEYELFDLVDISKLKVGDTLIINKDSLVIESIETLDTGLVLINGGLDTGGVDLITNENGVYYSVGYSDIKTYFEVGETEFKISPEFKFIDKSDLDKEPIEMTIDELMLSSTDWSGTPHNTSITIENNEITYMTRIYTP